MSKQIFIHIWKHQGEEIIQEHAPITNLEDAMKQNYQQELPNFEYQRTLLISYSTILKESLVNEINIKNNIAANDEIAKEEEQEAKDEHNKLKAQGLA